MPLSKHGPRISSPSTSKSSQPRGQALGIGECDSPPRLAETCSRCPACLAPPRSSATLSGSMVIKSLRGEIKEIVQQLVGLWIHVGLGGSGGAPAGLRLPTYSRLTRGEKRGLVRYEEQLPASSVPFSDMWQRAAKLEEALRRLLVPRGWR